MKANLCELQVLVHGKPVREFPHDGRLYVEGRKNTDFTLRVRNLTDQQILAVLSIDGLSIVTGEEASSKDSGYVLGPRGSLNIPGWSLSNDEVARFCFHKAAESYAAKTGKPRNVGVIGCAVFKSKYDYSKILRGSSFSLGVAGDPSSYSFGGDGQSRGVSQSYFMNDSDTRYAPDWSGVTTTSEMNCNATVQPQETERSGTPRRKSTVEAASEIGTGFGKRQGFRVQEVSFERESTTPNEVLEITYDTRKGLEKRGVDLDWRPTVARPNPFPGDRHCTPPEGWEG